MAAPKFARNQPRAPNNIKDSICKRKQNRKTQFKGIFFLNKVIKTFILPNQIYFIDIKI